MQERRGEEKSGQEEGAGEEVGGEGEERQRLIVNDRFYSRRESHSSRGHGV